MDPCCLRRAVDRDDRFSWERERRISVGFFGGEGVGEGGADAY